MHEIITIGKNTAILRSVVITDSNPGTKPYTLEFIFNPLANADEILNAIKDIKAQVEKMLNLPTGCSIEVVNFILRRKTHQKIRDSDYIQRIKYIDLVGMRDEICRQEQFRDAVFFHKFNEMLRKLRILNYFTSDFKTKRIIAVHPKYVEIDDEIREGLKVMHYKHAADHPVFVESEQALFCALNDCLPGTTLVIDGHWVHNKQSMHGVWDVCDAATLATKIANLVNLFHGKIAHINLLGCETGAVAPFLDQKIADGLFFKYDIRPELLERKMALQRNRAIYISNGKSTVFSPGSVAYELLHRLEDTNIAVTATPKLLYPYPPEDPQFNIGSDSEEWKVKTHFWNETLNPNQIVKRLGEVKSITQINIENLKTCNKTPWHLRLT